MFFYKVFASLNLVWTFFSIFLTKIHLEIEWPVVFFINFNGCFFSLLQIDNQVKGIIRVSVYVSFISRIIQNIQIKYLWKWSKKINWIFIARPRFLWKQLATLMWQFSEWSVYCRSRSDLSSTVLVIEFLHLL